MVTVGLKHKKKGERKKWKVGKVAVLINSWTWSARSCRKVQCGCRIARIADNFASRNFLTCAFQATAQYILPDTYLPDLLYILLWRWWRTQHPLHEYIFHTTCTTRSRQRQIPRIAFCRDSKRFWPYGFNTYNLVGHKASTRSQVQKSIEANVHCIDIKC